MAKRVNMSKMVVSCEWGSCSFRGTRMEELSEHMSHHLKDHLGEGDTSDELDDYPCLWRGCEFVAMGSAKELAVHAHFHIFHAKLMFVGTQQLQAHPELPPCGQQLNNSNLITELGGAFVCEWEHCDSTFNNAEWFYRHVEMHAHCTELRSLPDRQQVIFCSWKGCEAFFKIKYRLREHLRSHTQERIVACPTCGGMFSSNTKFLDHIQRQAQPDDALVCGHCDKRFANERLLRDHVRQHVNHIKCPLCDMTCTSLATLKIHIKFRHCDERPFPCDFCESCFKNQHDLRKHMETHNEGEYQCQVEGCNYTSRMSHTMRQHYRRFHEGSTVSRYKCHLCDKTFSWCYTLTLHLRNKHQLKWPSGHARFRYKKDDDGFMRLNMVRYETVEVTQEIMKNMEAKKPTPSKSKRPTLQPSPDSSPCSNSSPDSPPSQLDMQERQASSPLTQGAEPVYCVLNTVSNIEAEPVTMQEEESRSSQSGAERALAAVARGLGMDVV